MNPSRLFLLVVLSSTSAALVSACAAPGHIPESPQDGGVGATDGTGPVSVPFGGGTNVSGTLSGTLTKAGSPYRVVGDANHVVTVPKGKVLTVGPGVVLDFVGDPVQTAADTSGDEVMQHHAGRVELKVYGRLVVQGTAEEPAVLTSTNPSGWWGINFFAEESVGDGDPVFDHMIFEKVRKNDYNGDRELTRGAIWAYYPGGAVTVTNSVLRDNLSSADCGALDLMFTDGSRVEGNLFLNNRTSEVDRFGEDGATSTSGGGAMCITHGRNTIVRNNVFRGNTVEAFRGYAWADLVAIPFVQWPNGGAVFDLGGGGAVHYYQPDNDLIEDNVFDGNEVKLGPGAAMYFEDVSNQALTVRGNQFVNNRARAGAVIVCYHGSGAQQLVLDANTFSGNTVSGAAAPQASGDCTH